MPFSLFTATAASPGFFPDSRLEAIAYRAGVVALVSQPGRPSLVPISHARDVEPPCAMRNHVVVIKQAAGAMLFHPRPGEQIEAEDSLIALAEAPQLKEIE
jgi:hypothetical protein